MLSNSLLVLQALCLMSGLNVDGKIHSVKARRLGTGVELEVRGQGLPRPRIVQYPSEKMRVIEFDATLEGSGMKESIGYGGVRTISTYWHSAKPPKVRIDVALEKGAAPVIEESLDGWRIGFNLPSQTARTAGLLVSNSKELPAKLEPIETFRPVRLDRVTIDFVNTDVVQILKAIALQANVNIVASPDVKGNLTVSLKDVTIDDALKLVTSLASLSYAKVGEAFVVAPPDKIDAIRRNITGEPEPAKPDEPTAPAPEPLVTESYVVRGGLAADLVKSLADDKGMVGNTRLAATPATSVSVQTIVLRGPRKEVDELLQVLSQLDNPEQQAATTEIYEVKYADPRALREDLIAAFPGLRASIPPGPAGNPRLYNPNQIKGQVREGTETGPGQYSGTGTGDANAGAAGAATGPQGAALRTAEDVRATRESRGLTQPFSDFEAVAYPMKLVLRGSPALVRQARDYAARLDVQPKQVAIEMRVMELSREDALRIGLNWNILDTGGIVRLVTVDQTLGASSTTSGTVGAQFRGGHEILGTLDEIASKRNLIARPNMLALDGRETEVFIGDVLKYIKSIERNPLTGELKILIDEERVGVRLSVLARAGSDGNITMDLRPIVSTLRGYLNVAGGGQIPQISERITQSSTIIKTGETIALGGLIKDEDRKLSGGIPILKDLPIVGHLFRRTDNARERTEIVFFLTARIVDDTNRQDAARPKG